MKTIFSTLILLFITIISFSQTAQQYFDKGMAKAREGKHEDAIELFNKSIEIKPDEYEVWFYRGITKSLLGLYEEALLDFQQTIYINPFYKQAYLLQGIAKRNLTNIEGALVDYSYAISLDPKFADPYYYRAEIYELLNKRDSACADYKTAFELGMQLAEKKVTNCNDTTKGEEEIHGIYRLSKVSLDEKYGFSEDKPVKVGFGPDGGPANQRAYMDLLRDAQGKKITYERLGSCCSYKSDNGLFGYAMVDKYEITYLNEKNKKQTALIYISFYDYEEPEVLMGFGTIGAK